MSASDLTDLSTSRFPLRSSLTRRLDPVLIRRIVKLLHRQRRHALVDPKVVDALGEVQTAALHQVASTLRDGAKLSPALQARVSSLVGAYLQNSFNQTSPSSEIAAVCDAFERLFQPRAQPVVEPVPRVTRAIVDSFQRLYYSVSRRTWRDTWYRGILTYKCPTDMWVYQEIIDTLRPSLVIESGTFRGGSALFLADRLETIGHGHVLSIDIHVRPGQPEHPRITYLTGSSVSDAILDQVRSHLPDDGGHVLVILDSDHSRDHVAAELDAYAPLVTVDSYLIVEDTNINGHPAEPEFGPGPWEAAQQFLSATKSFKIDERCERYFLTQNPQGYLRRVK